MRVFLILFLLPVFASAFEVESPDGGVVVSLEVRGGEAIYQISAGGKAVVLPSKLGFLWEGSARVRRISEEGVSSCAPPLRCRYGVFRLHYDNAPDVLLHLRLWGDGVAWRYQVLSWRGVRVRGEKTSFALPPESRIWFQSKRNSKVHEGGFSAGESIPPLTPLPLTVELAGGGFLAIVERHVVAQPALLLSQKGRVLHAGFFDRSWRVSNNTPLPWRVLLIADSLDGLVNAVAGEGLVPAPSEKLFAERSYIRAGKAIWHWLSERRDGTLVERQKKYIEAAEKYGFEYSLIDAGWRKNFVRDAERAQVSRMETLAELVGFARERNVGLWLWLNVPDIIDAKIRRKLFARLHEIGVVGVKIDFFNRSFFRVDALGAMAAYPEILRDAAKERLMVNFHGAAVPSGLEVSFPNEMTREGVRGQEFENRPGALINPHHNVALIFTRMLAGHADYTPARLNQEALDKIYMYRTHELALLGLLDSPVQHVPVSPEELDGLSETDPEVLVYLREVPTIWEETIVLPPSEIGELGVIARRYKEDWYLFVISGRYAKTPAERHRVSSVRLSFLGEGCYGGRVFYDNPDKEIVFQERQCLTKNTKIAPELLSGGGFIVHLSPEK